MLFAQSLRFAGKALRWSSRCESERRLVAQAIHGMLQMYWKAIWISLLLGSSVSTAQQPLEHHSTVLTTDNTVSTTDNIAALLAAARRNHTPQAAAMAQHPLKPLLQWAQKNEERIARDIRDYTCLMVSRVRFHGKLQARQTMLAKVRHRKVVNGQVNIPFSFYLKLSQPDRIKDREVLFVENNEENKILVRNGGRRLPSLTLSLDPHGAVAMRGNRFPITEFGVHRLTQRMIEIGDREMRYGDCTVKAVDDVQFDDRPCVQIEITHANKVPHFDYHLARLYIDKELQLPVRFESYDWPADASDTPVLLEEYSYQRLKLNVGLTDADFDRNNPEYEFRPKD